jgi:hypothetical protein
VEAVLSGHDFVNTERSTASTRSGLGEIILKLAEIEAAKPGRRRKETPRRSHA